MDQEQIEETLEIITAEEDKLLFADEAYRHYLKFLSTIAEKLIQNDIRERTQVDENEIAVIAMLSALVNSEMERNLPRFSGFIKSFIDQYLHLAISKNRKSRSEIIEAVRAAFRLYEEKGKKSIMEKLLRE